MTRDDFKILHSELIMYCQCIEFDLKRIYSGMSTGDFNDNMDMLETSNLGRTLTKLKRLDYSDGNLICQSLTTNFLIKFAKFATTGAINAILISYT